LYDFESPDLEVIPPGVDIGRFRPLDKDESDKELEVPERFIFSLSRIDSNKGIDYLIRAFALASEKTDACLVIGGGSKNPKDHEIEVKSDLERLVAELGLEERVRFTGYIPDEQLEVYYRKAQLFVLPSKYEPFGMTVLEAMACGTPVVATRLGGLRNVLHDGEDSLLVDPSDPDELSTTISRMLSDRKLASRLAENGMRLVREQYSWDGIAKRTLSFYRRYL
jgi:mannosylfructose-phosphate synthase